MMNSDADAREDKNFSKKREEKGSCGYDSEQMKTKGGEKKMSRKNLECGFLGWANFQESARSTMGQSDQLLTCGFGLCGCQKQR